MSWGVAWTAPEPDGDSFLALAYGPNKGALNMSFFDLPAFNDVYLRQSRLSDGPERLALMQQAAELMAAYMPYKFGVNRIATDVMQPWVIGFRRNQFAREFYKFVDVDTGVQQRYQRPAK